MSRAIAVINVRMGSGRLPGKALRTVAGKPVLEHLLARVRRARNLDGVVVATSTLPENDAIAAFCAAHALECFRGSEHDVLGRTLGALEAAHAEPGVVVYGDGPLIDPAIIDRFIEQYSSVTPSCDFLGNDLSTSYSPGMEVEVFSVAALADSARRCIDPAIREHGTLFIRQHPQLYRLFAVEAPAELRRPDLHLELDTEADLAVIGAILHHFGDRTDFTLAQIIEFLDRHPALGQMNRIVPRRWRAFRADADASLKSAPRSEG